MKKIMFIHQSGGIGGAGVSLYNTVLTLSKEFEVIVYCPSEPDLYYKYLKEKNVNVKTYNFPLGSIPHYNGGNNVFSPSFLKSILNIKIHSKRWEKILATEEPNLVIVNSRILCWFSILTNKIRTKSICFVRETRKKSKLNIVNYIQRMLLERFSAVVFISNYDKEQENLVSAKPVVIPNFVDMKYYLESDKNLIGSSTYGIEESSFKILFVGGMLRMKGYDVAVKALKHLKNYDVCLIVAGDPDFRYRDGKKITDKMYNLVKKKYENNINNEIRKNGLADLIVKVGIQKDMRFLYKTSDILIFPANVPHQARPAFEAGAQKKSVIMPDFENTREYIKDGVNGLIFKHHDSKSLADKITLLIENKELKVKLGEENFKHTMENHTKELSEKLLLEIVNEIISNETL